MSAKAYKDFLKVLAEELPDVPSAVLVESAWDLCRSATRCQRFKVLQSARELTERETRERLRIINKTVLPALDRIGLIHNLRFNDEPPSNSPYRVILPSGQSNSWTGEGYCVPCLGPVRL